MRCMKVKRKTCGGSGKIPSRVRRDTSKCCKSRWGRFEKRMARTPLYIIFHSVQAFFGNHPSEIPGQKIFIHALVFSRKDNAVCRGKEIGKSYRRWFSERAVQVWSPSPLPFRSRSAHDARHGLRKHKAGLFLEKNDWRATKLRPWPENTRGGGGEEFESTLNP